MTSNGNDGNVAKKTAVKRRETDLGRMIVKNMARVMESERQARDMTKTEFRVFLKLSAPTYFGILDGKANPTIFVITRISEGLRIPLYDLLMGTTEKAP